MRCVLELFGILRDIARSDEIVFELQSPATLRDLLCSLKMKSPSLSSFIFAPGEDALKKAFILSVNNGAVVNDLDSALKDGDRISLLYPVSGG